MNQSDTRAAIQSFHVQENPSRRSNGDIKTTSARKKRHGHWPRRATAPPKQSLCIDHHETMPPYWTVKSASALPVAPQSVVIEPVTRTEPAVSAVSFGHQVVDQPPASPHLESSVVRSVPLL
jgi:hypothetical protein